MNGADDAADEGNPGQTRRLDRWLWFARIVKSRTMAAALIEDGRARVNRQKVLKPSQAVRPGDILTLAIGPGVRVLKIFALGERRGPAAEARTLYEDLTHAEAPRPGVAPSDQAVRLQGSGRPTKRERRQMERLKGT